MCAPKRPAPPIVCGLRANPQEPAESRPSVSVLWPTLRRCVLLVHNKTRNPTAGDLRAYRHQRFAWARARMRRPLPDSRGAEHERGARHRQGRPGPDSRGLPQDRRRPSARRWTALWEAAPTPAASPGPFPNTFVHESRTQRAPNALFAPSAFSDALHIRPYALYVAPGEPNRLQGVASLTPDERVSSPDERCIRRSEAGARPGEPSAGQGEYASPRGARGARPGGRGNAPGEEGRSADARTSGRGGRSGRAGGRAGEPPSQRGEHGGRGIQSPVDLLYAIFRPWGTPRSNVEAIST